MEINIDSQQFDKRQRAVIQEIACNIKEALEEAGLNNEKELVESLVFDICAILGGSREMEVDGKPLLPFLTFADERGPRLLLAAESGSWMHEISGGIVEEIFEDESGD